MSLIDLGELLMRATTRTLSLGCLAALALVTAAEFGAFPKVFGGFATADSVSMLARSSQQHWAYEAEDAIMDMREKQCDATNKDLRHLYAQTIQKRTSEYRVLTGQSFPLPPCGDL